MCGGRTALFLVVVLYLGKVTAEEKKTKVLILGGGLSGFTAAKTLLDNGITDFLILEAQNYTGGRIRTVPFANLMIEDGANWIHFTEDKETEPIMKRKKAKSMSGIQCDYSDIAIRDEKGVDITDFKVVKTFHKVVEEGIEEFQETRRSGGHADMPARVGMQLMGWKPTKPIEKVVEYFHFDFEYSTRPEMVSFYHMFARGEDFFVTDQRGLWSMYEDLYKPLANRTLLRKVVKKIKYSPSSVEVTTDGNVYKADYALCTFSTGVLASDDISFDPPLPKDKMESIYKSPMAAYLKIFLKFPSKFWDDHEYILYASKVRGRFPVFQDLDRPGILPAGSAVLLVTVTEDEARRIEGQSNNETKTELMKILRQIYGEGIPDPTAIHYRRWSLNKFTRGSYSEGVVGRTSEDFKTLGKNLDRLYFSGEATSEEWYGYMQGAFLTGEEKGHMIADAVLGRVPPPPARTKNHATDLKPPGCFLLFILSFCFGNKYLRFL